MFPKPPIDLTTFGTGLTTFGADIAAAKDGGTVAITAKNKQRSVVIVMMRQQAAYVEATADNDPSIFALSGFVPISTTRTPAAPLAPAVVRKVVQGNTGILKVIVTAQPGAKTYDVRQAVLGS